MDTMYIFTREICNFQKYFYASVTFNKEIGTALIHANNNL